MLNPMEKSPRPAIHLARAKLFAIIACISLSAPALAMKGSELDKLLTDQTVEGDAYLSGLADGFNMRDALRINPSRYEFCQPLTVTLSTSDYRKILQEQLADQAKQAYITHLPAYLVLLIGMHEKYPCRKAD